MAKKDNNNIIWHNRTIIDWKKIGLVAWNYVHHFKDVSKANCVATNEFSKTVFSNTTTHEEGTFVVACKQRVKLPFLKLIVWLIMSFQTPSFQMLLVITFELAFNNLIINFRTRPWTNTSISKQMFIIL